MKKASIINILDAIIIVARLLSGRKTQIMFNINLDLREDCKMRHENGNCLPCGGFCTAVNNEICQALHNAYNHGFVDCHKIIRKGKEENV
jgi:hypothetical protein